MKKSCSKKSFKETIYKHYGTKLKLKNSFVTIIQLKMYRMNMIIECTSY